MQLMHYGTPSFRFELIRQVKEILVFGTLVEKKEKKKKRRETSIHPPRLLLHHLCTLLPRATDKSRQIWGKNTEITTETNFPFTKMEISNVC